MAKKTQVSKSENSQAEVKRRNAPGQGRKTDYDPKFAEEIIKFFSVKPYEKAGDQFLTNDLPTLSGFAIQIGVHRDTIRNWRKANTDFDEACKIAKEHQENFLVINGLRGLINPTFGMFTLKNLQNWKDKTETTKKIKIDPDQLKKMSIEDIQKLIAEVINEMGDDE